MAASVTQTYQSVRDFTLVIISFFGMMRESEVVALTINEMKIMTVAGKPCLAITVRKAKNDQLYKGHTRLAGITPLICPVWWFTLWWMIRSVSAQPIFHNMSPYVTVTLGPVTVTIYTDTCTKTSSNQNRNAGGRTETIRIPQL